MEQDQPRPSSNTPALASAIAPQITHEAEEEGISLGEILATLMEYKWLIASITLAALIGRPGLYLCLQAGLPRRWPASG
jgi:hypothetical protein